MLRQAESNGTQETMKMFRNATDAGQNLTIISPRTGWKLLDLKELGRYRDLFYYLVTRDIKVTYAQTILGFSWAILQPLIQIVIFTVVFGKVAKVSTDGLPYILFSTAAIIPWTYMSQAVTLSSQSLVLGQNLLGKIYFPRIFFPVTPVLSRLVDFIISTALLFAIMIYYGVTPTWRFLLLPLFIFMMVLASAGAGFWLSSLAIRFRDIKHGMPFVIRMFMYTAPIVYSASSIPEKYRLLYSLNPLVAVIEGFRASLLGLDYCWQYILPGILVTILVTLSGLLYYNRSKHFFADVI
jgi:lipopolysaccharide transport system permease protein